jgi:hypothetical protein
MMAELAKNKKQLAKYGGALPTGGTPTPAAKTAPKPTTFMEAMEQADF